MAIKIRSTLTGPHTSRRRSAHAEAYESEPSRSKIFSATRMRNRQSASPEYSLHLLGADVCATAVHSRKEGVEESARHDKPGKA